LAGGVRRCARRIAALLRGGDLLLEISRFARVEAQFRDWDGGHVHIILRTWSACSTGSGTSDKQIQLGIVTSLVRLSNVTRFLGDPAAAGGFGWGKSSDHSTRE
jgi:hypothetical protein